ncbi:hypothetical protein JTE90_017884 [Oedothorax gibbosus]|uniref:Uncharacterized protein n=1 Tax=Oedothorax gibbosus TaxID=931172 RepID=A0AAV6V1W3_9ARAC|nr:hypothetical protein JTE90_017884 [Oedothorax gibbosus]
MHHTILSFNHPPCAIQILRGKDVGWEKVTFKFLQGMCLAPVPLSGLQLLPPTLYNSMRLESPEHVDRRTCQNHTGNEARIEPVHFSFAVAARYGLVLN